MKINNNQNTFRGLSSLARPLNCFYNSNAIIPTLIIESGVTLGRSAVASQRGGKMEASERFVEQGVSAIVWLFGVQTLKKIGDKIGEKLFKLDLNFDVGFNHLRNPIKNNNIPKFAKNFKVANMLISTAIATYFIGFILPKINHKISSHFIEHSENKKNNSSKKINFSSFTRISFNEFQNKIKQKTQNDKNISFSSLADKTLSLAHLLENNQTARLLITDTGVIAGRCKNSRNKYEKIESFFRDASSIYFYLFSTKHFVKLMDKLTNNTDIDPKTLECIKNELSLQLKKSNGNISSLTQSALGKITPDNFGKLQQLFSENQQVINVDDFIKLFPSLENKAKEMAKLQPIFNNKSVLSYQEASDVLRNGWLTTPEFLKSTIEKTTNGASQNKLRFVTSEQLSSIRTSIDNFIKQVEEYAQKKNIKIDEKLIEKVTNQSIRKNFAYYTVGTGISILFLSYIIPKIQYSITKILTNEDKFPGAYKE